MRRGERIFIYDWVIYDVRFMYDLEIYLGFLDSRKVNGPILDR